jgi:glucose/arabinose dehydrogenase
MSGTQSRRLLRRCRRAAFAIVCGLACVDTIEPLPQGEARLLVSANVAGTAITTVVVSITAADIATPIVANFAVSGQTISGSIVIPAGSRRIVTARAFDDGGVETHSGADTLSVQAGQNPALNLRLTAHSGDIPLVLTLANVRVTLTPSADTLVAGGLGNRLVATVTNADGSPLNVRVQWATLHPGVATVDSTGFVSGISKGTTQIVAVYAGVAASATIAVLAPADVVLPTLKVVATGLDQPLFVAAAPGDTMRLFILQQSGKILVARNDTVLATPFLDLTDKISCCNERGLLGLAFHPLYATNGLFFVYITDPAGHTSVLRYRASSDPNVADATSGAPILAQTQPFPNHNGGMLAFGKDGYLYIGLGDGGSSNDPQKNGQSTRTLLGKILRIDVDNGSPYAVPPTNPFVGRSDALPEIWALGLRNPWRFSFDRQTGDLYIGDVGQNAREEIDVEVAPSTGGKNYGWSVMEGTTCVLATDCAKAGLSLPVLEYAHAAGCHSLTGGYVYRGSRVPTLTGHYFYSDYCKGWVRSFRYVNGSVTNPRDWPALVPGGNIASFGEDGRGELYIVTQGVGAVYRIIPRP